jgi:hypothetical protein
VVVALATSPTLLPGHPRMDVRPFPDQNAAFEAHAALGAVPIDRSPW